LLTLGFDGAAAGWPGLLRQSGTGRRWAHATRMTRAVRRRCLYGSFKCNCFAAVDQRRENQAM